MMEILFGESAAGGLVCARLCKSADVLSFALALDAGDIAQEGIGRARMDTLRALFSFAPDEIGEEAARHCFAAAKAGWESAKKRMLAGEEARLWTSAQPDERCGLSWFAHQMKRWGVPAEQLWIAELPAAEESAGVRVEYNGWGDVLPENFARLSKAAQRCSPMRLLAESALWGDLMQENAPLRAQINGKLHSVPEDFYDFLIERAIDRQGGAAFLQAKVIGEVLGRDRPGVGDGFLALRMEKMIERGTLCVVTEAPSDAPGYHRMLRQPTS